MKTTLPVKEALLTSTNHLVLQICGVTVTHELRPGTAEFLRNKAAAAQVEKARPSEK